MGERRALRQSSQFCFNLAGQNGDVGTAFIPHISSEVEAHN